MDFVINYLFQGIIQILVILHLVTPGNNNSTIERKGFEGVPVQKLFSISNNEIDNWF
jgi:hypothetical protein